MNDMKRKLYDYMKANAGVETDEELEYFLGNLFDNGKIDTFLDGRYKEYVKSFGNYDLRFNYAYGKNGTSTMTPQVIDLR